MDRCRIAVIVGSLRKESFNRKLADLIGRVAPDELELQRLDIGRLPLYNQDDDSHQAPAVQEFKHQIRASAGVMFVTPEYNRSIPGVLKNAIDHASRPYGDSAWKGKPAGIIGASPGTFRTIAAQQHLRTVLANLDMPTLGQPEAFIHVSDTHLDKQGHPSDDTRAFIEKWLKAFADWVAQHRR